MCMCCVSCCGLRCTVTGADLTTAKRNRRAATAHLGTCETVGVGARYATRPLSRRLWWPVAGPSSRSRGANRDCRISPGAWHSLPAGSHWHFQHGSTSSTKTCTACSSQHDEARSSASSAVLTADTS